ncbi:uncharacterized protein CcaverHIS019_0404140 [Cutaneotrichosporon cavernicola]|uniref:Pirin n=1 Tax=Cutaneotrichosporon cavernicola TaxID=279322 RepID=A0AA48L434_9TREE|nr:uncharacterized protein CcaverHIS019_0404140 [Cutaneotrichosporon cavernicola]BEI91594.1 hypothetical protein CcaverHIS019_0404140 [Cutaneotrichosporon cavernicola]
MLSALRSASPPRAALSRGLATAAEVSASQISRIVHRTRFAERVGHHGPIIHAALRPSDKCSPFLLLDYASMPRGTGFPDHPHRGLTTVSQILQGQWAHEDFLGNAGTLQPGEVQWMTAGRGIVHSEMPVFEGPDSVDPMALQLWVDIPAEHKMDPPSYMGITQDQPSEGIEIGVISGESHGVVNEKRDIALGGTWWLDIKLTKAGAKVWQPIPEGWTAFIFVIEGNLQIHEGAPIDQHNTAILTKHATQNGVLLRLPSGDNSPTRAALFAGPPLDQVAFTRGPFVMTNREDAYAAVDDFNAHRNGFENAEAWQSKIGGGKRLRFPDIGIV